MSSCEKDEVKVTAEPGSAPVLTASATAVDLKKEDADKVAVTYSWTPITLTFSEAGFPATMTYTLQFAKKGTNFATTKDVDASGVVRKAFTVSEVNALFKDLGFPIGQPAQLDVRLKSSYSANVAPYTTALTSLSGTPYESRELPALVWGLIGPAGKGWDTDVVMDYDYDKKVWTLTTDLKADLFKFRANKAWTVNLGDEGPNGSPAKDGPLKASGGDIKLAEAGNYTITLDYNATPKPTYTIKKN
ncbi:SusE domain-containing protein [Hymenobacter lucidus]|uniref:SusE domain-containing protein n=1 Tax=Hymenobacter lucidus TaxID=2880930 RepID=A0ABS8APZ7_9BACT|nr:SusE domain-containing protein [Hymenobacter lucidus]MCB2407809.1 SusE domain-containing protein [Hymenobacter lucidus]